MPYSSDIFDNLVRKVLKKWGFKTYLDIGAGSGKYGIIIKSIDKSTHVTGIESEKDYIDRFNLRSLYDVIIHTSAASIVNGDQGTVYDVIIMGDIIEHLLKSDGMNLINFLMYRCKKMILVFPEKYVQYDVDGRKSESHRSVWGDGDFTYFKFMHRRKGYMNLFIIDGFLADKKSIIKPNG